LRRPHIDGEPGDLKLKINMLQHDRFWRVGDDLYTNVTIGLDDALQGFEMKIAHLDAHFAHVKRAEVTRPGEVVMLKGQGMTSYDNNNNFGNLYVTFDVEFPTGVLPAVQKDALATVLEQYTVVPKTYRGMGQ
jgi:DnaJ family protein B protein 11